jgi:hypothetical protein
VGALDAADKRLLMASEAASFEFFRERPNLWTSARRSPAPYRASTRAYICSPFAAFLTLLRAVWLQERARSNPPSKSPLSSGRKSATSPQTRAADFAGLSECGQADLRDLRETRNQIVHYGFSPRDDDEW